MDPEEFKTGDRVRHIGAGKNGIVTILPNGDVQVVFDTPNTRGRRSIGIYDPNWFRVYPNGLVPARMEEEGS